jgi:hypothetical protein
MKGKLITDGKNNYSLLDYNNELIGTTMESMITNQKLSLKNCDEIFGVVDVEKLAEKEYPNGIDGTDRSSEIYRRIYKEGFNKAMELNKDKVFTLEQMSVAYNTNRSGTLFEQLINSFGGQPTEIDVVIEMYDFELPGKPIGRRVIKPKLNSEGCLILKKI